MITFSWHLSPIFFDVSLQHQKEQFWKALLKGQRPKMYVGLGRYTSSHRKHSYSR